MIRISLRPVYGIGERAAGFALGLWLVLVLLNFAGAINVLWRDWQ